MTKEEKELQGQLLKLARIKQGLTIPEVSKLVKSKIRNTSIQKIEQGNDSELIKVKKIFTILGEKPPTRLTLEYIEEVQEVLTDRFNNEERTGANVGSYSNKYNHEMRYLEALKSKL